MLNGRVIHGEPSQQIIAQEQEQEQDSDLIIVGKHGMPLAESQSDILIITDVR